METRTPSLDLAAFSWPERAHALPDQTFEDPALLKMTHARTHKHRAGNNTTSFPTCLSLDFPVPPGRETWAMLGASGMCLLLVPPLSCSASFEADFPQLTIPLPQYQLTGYQGNPAGRLPVTTATQHGRQAALLRKVRGPAGRQSHWDVAGRNGPYVPEGIKFLLSGGCLSDSHEAGSPSWGQEL